MTDLAAFTAEHVCRLTGLSARQLGYWDTTGSLYLAAPGGVFFIDRPAPTPADRRLQNLYRGRSAQVLHALLLEPGRSWHVGDLARKAAASPYTVHQVFTRLEELVAW